MWLILFGTGKSLEEGASDVERMIGYICVSFLGVDSLCLHAIAIFASLPSTRYVKRVRAVRACCTTRLYVPGCSGVPLRSSI